MIRKIIHINEEKCNGCGACANACHEGAIQMVDGKARLMRDVFAMALVTVCRPVRQMQSHLKNVKRMLMMMMQ